MTMAPIAQDISALSDCVRALAPDGVGVACGSVRNETAGLYDCELTAISGAVEKRRSEFSTGRFLARRAMAEIGYPAVALPVGPSRRPCWPDGMTGSLSHSATLCAVVVASTARFAVLGFDIECISDVPSSILPSIAEPEEIGDLSRQFSFAILPAILFSAREAIFKAYNPVTDHHLEFKDITLEISGSDFCAKFNRPDIPRFFGRDTVEGRFAFTNNLIVSLVAVPSEAPASTSPKE
jgi:4'-phosphopantetheinyl transferase EntD